MNSVERHEARYQRRRARRLKRKSEYDSGCVTTEDVFTYDNLYASYKKCLRGVNWKYSVQSYQADAPILVYQSYREIAEDRLVVRPGSRFILYERGKLRKIRGVNIKERVIQKCLSDHCLKRVLGRSLIYDNHASRAGKGTRKARERLQCHLERQIRRHGPNSYALVFDFSGFFDSFDHNLVRQYLMDTVGDPRIVDLTMKFVNSSDIGRGLELGSEVNQDLAISVSSTIDHFVKEVLQIHNYGRYMDDGYMLHESKEYLEHCLVRFKEFVESLGFKLNTKKTRIISLTKDGFQFLKTKYRVTQTGKIIKRCVHSSVVRMRRKLKKLRIKLTEGKLKFLSIYSAFQSWKSSISHCNCYITVKSMTRLFLRLYHNECTEAGFINKLRRCL